MSRRVLLFAAGACFGALAVPDVVRAQGDEALDRTPESCISTSRVRSTHVVDDRTILFYMRGRRLAYLNELPRDCPRLAREGRFSYRTHGGRLCDSDTITVLESFGGRFQSGATCRLGEFLPITRAEAREIEAAPERAEGDVGVEEVEVPEGAEDDAAEPQSPESAEPSETGGD